MKEIKSKKTGIATVLSDEDYAVIVNKKPDMLKRFSITDLKARAIIPSLKVITPEVKKSKPQK
jgi:hypothetical protein